MQAIRRFELGVRGVTLSIVFLSVLSTSYAQGPIVATASHEWPQWRGPSRDSTVHGGVEWPDSLGELTERWRVALGPGYSGPIVWGDRVFVTETENAEIEIVRALDRKTGAELWRASWSGAINVPFFAKSNGDWIRSTPACDGESLYVGGMRDVLVCLDVASGAVRWRFDFPEKLGSPIPAFGFVSSPLIVGEFVYVQAGGAFVKLNKRTGELVWKSAADKGGMDSAFSSPVLANFGGMNQLLVQMRDELFGLHPDDGQILWRQTVPAYRGMNILTPLVYEDGVFTSTYKNRTFFFRVAYQDGAFSLHEAWSHSAQGYMSSPVLIEHHAYLHLGNGRLCCIDLRSGKETWRSKPFGKYWSMVAREKRILALDESGELLLIEANPHEFTLLDRRKASDQDCWAHVAVSRNEIVVRDLAGVTLFDWRNANTQDSKPSKKE